MTFSLIVNCCIFGYVINECKHSSRQCSLPPFIYIAVVGNIMDNIERSSKTSKRELRLVNSYMQQKHVNRELQTRIRNYLEYMHHEER